MWPILPLEAPAAPANGEFETRELPLVTPGNAPAGGALGMAGAPAPVQNNPDAADLAAPSSTPSAPEVAAGNYAVNFGAYATSADADAVIARLKQAQLPGFSEKTQISGRPAWRVRVGPYADQAQAESARLQAVKVRSDVNAQVVTLDANAGAPSPVASTLRPHRPQAEQQRRRRQHHRTDQDREPAAGTRQSGGRRAQAGRSGQARAHQA